MSISLNYNSDNNELPTLTGSELVQDLLNGSKIVEMRHTGAGWFALIERDIKLNDCNGRKDETWKYGIYRTDHVVENDEFWLASDHNETPRAMLKRFDADFWEVRGHIRRMAA